MCGVRLVYRANSELFSHKLRKFSARTTRELCELRRTATVRVGVGSSTSATLNTLRNATV
jgi:hypothetical protein